MIVEEKDNHTRSQILLCSLDLSVFSMYKMFYGASSFNKPLIQWNVGLVSEYVMAILWCTGCETKLYISSIVFHYSIPLPVWALCSAGPPSSTSLWIAGMSVKYQGMKCPYIGLWRNAAYFSLVLTQLALFY
jgi:hypothetical protein